MFKNTENKLIWKNGSFQKWDDTNVHILSHTLHYGTGVFEGVRAYKTSNGPAIFRLHEHTDRLFNAADKLNIKIPFSKDQINNIQCEILNKNNLNEGYIRPIVYLGNEGLGLRAKDLSVNVAVAAWEWPSYMDPQAKEEGISVIKSSHRQYENPLHSGNKIIGTYFSNTMALHEALDSGADEAIMLDKNGYISEGSGENIFLVKDNIIFTPTTDHCLNGITRQSVIKIAKDLNMSVHEKNIDLDDLVKADEAFFTGTAVEITPINSLDKNGYISEGSGENIFLVKDNIIFTPTTDHCLNGITRQSVIKIAKDLNMIVHEKNIDLDDLVKADEAFFTGTAVEITPITSLNKKFINDGKRGIVTKQLQEKFQDIISGMNLTYDSWLTYTR